MSDSKILSIPCVDVGNLVHIRSMKGFATGSYANRLVFKTIGNQVPLLSVNDQDTMVCLIISARTCSAMYKVGYAMSEEDRTYHYMVYRAMVCGLKDVMIEISAKDFEEGLFTCVPVTGKQAEELTRITV